MDIKRCVLGICFFGAACTLGPDFVPLNPDIPKDFHRDANPATVLTAPGQPVDSQWWRTLNDPLLNQLVDRIATANLDVQTATSRVAQSRAQRGVAAADFYPQVHGDASYTREKESDKGIVALFSGASGGGAATGGGGAGGGSGGGTPTTGIPSSMKSPPFDLYQYGFDASWEIDLWGRVRRNVEAADATVQATEEERHDTTLSAIAELVRDYVQLRGTQADLKTARENVRTANDLATLTHELYRGGLGNDVDTANARAQAATTAAKIPQMEAQEASSMNAIALLLGQPPGGLESMLKTPKPIPVTHTPVPLGLPSELIHRRPDIRQAEAQLHVATADIGVAKADFFPQVTLMGNGALQALALNNLNDWAARTYQFGPSISLPIFEGGRLKSTLTLRNEQQREAALTYQKTVLNAFHEVDNALTTYRTEQQRYTQLVMATAENRNAFTLARERYKKGLGNYLDVLTAERRYLQAQEQTTQTAQSVTVAMVQLSKALGGGWEQAFPDEGRALAVSPTASPHQSSSVP